MNSIEQSHFTQFFEGAKHILDKLDLKVLEKQVAALLAVRQRQGRVFVLGLGGSAANASHLVNDFRKLCHIEAYAPTDNVSELTARINDEGFDTCFSEWLKVSRLSKEDLILVLSVGGGHLEKKVSLSLVQALLEAKHLNCPIIGIVGPEGGETRRLGDAVLQIPTPNPGWTTPYAEAFQGLIWHAWVSHPQLQRHATKW